MSIKLDFSPSALSPDQEAHLLRIKTEFHRAVDAKYRAGALEHGGDLHDMTLLQLIDNAMQECIDQWTYLQTLREKYLQQEQDRFNDAP